MSRFKPVGPASARRYLDTETGNEVSRRQRDKIMEAEGDRKRKDQGFIDKVRAAVSQFWDAVKSAISGTSKKRLSKPSTTPKSKSKTGASKAELKAARAKVMSDLRYQIEIYKRTGKRKPAPFAETFTNKKDIDKARELYEEIMGKQSHRRNVGVARQGRRASSASKPRKPVGGYQILA